MAQSYNKARNISQNTIKRLYGLSGNVCANPKCRNPLVTEDNQIGEIAHICAASPDGPRYDSKMTDDERRSIDNLILLCETCNKLVDSNEKDYPVSLLKEWKNNHEGLVSSDIYNTYFQNILSKQKEGVLRKQEIDIEGNIYSSRIVVSRGETVLKDDKGKHCLAGYLLSLAKDYKWEELPDVFIQGIGGVGKSTEVKYAYNKFLDVFSDTKNYDDYNFFPIVYFFELKNFQRDFYKKFDEKENIILFLDGLDEISGINLIELVKYLKNIRSQFTNVRFVISGRQASFDSEINGVSQNKILIDLTDDFDQYEATNRKLIERFQNSAILDVITIPFYRKYLETNEDISGYKDFFEKVVLHLLDKDKQKSDYANNIPAREKDKSSIDRGKVIEELSNLCYETFCNGRIVFSERELKDSTQDDFLFVINSSLIKYSESEKISFVSNLFFEYFLALYYLKHESKIKKDFFLSSGRLNIKFVNIISIIFNIADSKIQLVSRLKKRLSKETNAYILLTDYRTLSPQNRASCYKKIFEEFEEKSKIIYYLRWRSSFNCLSGISALNKAMCGLIPAEGKEEIFEYLIGYVKKYHCDRTNQNLIGYTNAIILLGLWGEIIWGKSQQEQLKHASIEIIKTFLNDTLAKEKTRGLLSESAILNWYKTYGWTKGWSSNEWNDFLKQLFPNTLGFGKFESYEEFYFQLEVFNDFSDDDYIRKIAKSLCIEVMKHQCNENQHADIIPDEIDDNYKTPCIHTDGEINSFIYSLKDGNYLSADDAVDIINELNHAHIIFHSTNYEFGELKKIIFDFLQKNGRFISMGKVEIVYGIISYAMDEKREFPFYEIEPCLKDLPDQLKLCLLEKILQNIGTLTWNRDWYFWSLVTLLLDISDETLARTNLQLVREKVTAGNDNSLLMKIYNTVDGNRPLYKAIKSEYEKTFEKKIQEDKARDELLAKLEKEHNDKLSQESILLLDSSKIIEEINAIEEFFKNNSSNGISDYHFFDLEYENIEHNIRYEINFKCRHTPVFSDFVVKFLQPFEKNGPFATWFDNARYIVKRCFSDDNNFWIGFYDCYVRSHSDEEVKNFLKKNENVKQKIVDTMAIGVCASQKSLDVQQIISLNCPIWVTPFIRYVQIVFDGKIPEYVDKEKLLTIVAYLTRYLVTEKTLFKNQPSWGNCNSAFDWLHKVAGFNYSKIVDKALEIYPQTDNLYIKMQLLSDLIEHLDCREREIANIVLDETRRVLAKPEKSNAGTDFRYASLSDFWQKADGKYLIEIIDVIPFEKYELRHENPCLREVIEFALKHMSMEQKEKLIAKYEDSKDGEIRELMRRLGSKKEILRKVSEYLHGGKCDSHFGYNHAHLFGFVKKNIFVLIAYWKLFDYSMKKESERRSALATIATKGIKEHIGSRTFIIFRFLMNRRIKQRIKDGKYVEGLYDFMDEVEQKVYAR
ncbi:NACHT domain-containing protein [Fibrobacter sp. UBA2449]|uniref:NACHT domain-containing protein n=1 Tax=Fibrobacter sp. UBA2449 TaxID=1946529 RepID=UPI0025BE547B|nr:hypothetical protein [Fibrobacter sp. UBA2449]